MQYGDRVFGIDIGIEERRIDEAIDKTESFFQSLNIKTKLSDYGISKEQLEPIITRFKDRGWKLGEMKTITPNRIEKILISAL